LDEIDSDYSKVASSATVPETQVKYNWRKDHQFRADLTYVNCWHINNSESSWMWRNYAKSSESIIIQSTLRRLRSCFNGKNDYLFMGCILYIDHETFVSGPKHSLDSFMRKNLFFKNENELRIIFYSGLYNNKICHGVHKSVDVITLVKQVICHPHSSDDFIRKVRKLLNDNSLDIKMRRSEIIL
jgi:hypothetical protein